MENHQPKIKTYASIVDYNGNKALMIKGFITDSELIKKLTQDILKNDLYSTEIEIKFFRKLNAIIRLKEAKLI